MRPGQVLTLDRRYPVSILVAAFINVLWDEFHLQNTIRADGHIDH